MVISVHPLCQDIPLKVLSHLDSDGETRNPLVARLTPFVTVVTDLGGAHPTWYVFFPQTEIQDSWWNFGGLIQ